MTKTKFAEMGRALEAWLRVAALSGGGGCGWCLGGLEPSNEILSGKVISGWTPKTTRTASGSPELDGGGSFRLRDICQRVSFPAAEKKKKKRRKKAPRWQDGPASQTQHAERNARAAAAAAAERKKASRKKEGKRKEGSKQEKKEEERRKEKTACEYMYVCIYRESSPLQSYKQRACTYE